MQAGGEGWNGATSVALVVGDDRNDLSYMKSRCMQLWLFGYHLPGIRPLKKIRYPINLIAALL